MKILYLSPHDHLIPFLESNGDSVVQSVEPMVNRETNQTTEEAKTLLDAVDFIVSYGYRFKVPEQVTAAFTGRAINLHTSYLPWNRGADPNLWSFLEDTPKGVTIHYLDGNIDTGEIIVQERVEWAEGDTLRTSYRRLTDTIERLFREHWPAIREGRVKSMPQLTYHRSRDKDRYAHLLAQGWDTPVESLIGKARE